MFDMSPSHCRYSAAPTTATIFTTAAAEAASALSGTPSELPPPPPRACATALPEGDGSDRTAGGAGGKAKLSALRCCDRGPGDDCCCCCCRCWPGDRCVTASGGDGDGRDGRARDSERNDCHASARNSSTRETCRFAEAVWEGNPGRWTHMMLLLAGRTHHDAPSGSGDTAKKKCPRLIKVYR